MPARHTVILRPSSTALVDAGYDLRIGPLAFTTPADKVSEDVGGGLDAVGSALAPSDPRVPTLGLKVPIAGARRDVDPWAAGMRLRRQIRGLLNNARWREHGLYLTWAPDADLDGWLRIGGGTIGEADPGVTFADFDLDLRDVYIVGRPGTHRPGRRAMIGDRRTGLVARDTRRLLYSTDFNGVALPTEPLVLPGDVVDFVATGNRPVASSTAGPLLGARRLWRTVSASDQEVVHYRPDEAILNTRTKYLDLDALGAVRIWDMGAAGGPSVATYSAEAETDPDLYRSWERVFGDLLTPDRPIAIDNGACRLIWLGPAASQGLAIEYWDSALGYYRRIARVLHALSTRDVRVIEATNERAVVEWRAGRYALRAILQRGWEGPRLESYDDGGGTARLDVQQEASTAAWTNGADSGNGVVSLTDFNGRIIRWARGTTADTWGAGSVLPNGAGFTRTRVVVAQVSAPGGLTAAAVAGLALVDAQPVPVLVGAR